MNASSVGRSDVGSGSFVSLAGPECLELLASKRVGRVGFTGPHGPQIMPVTYALRDGTIVFRTAPYSTLATHIAAAAVAFQVDDIDEFLSCGWSVLVLGAATRVDRPDELAALWAHDDPAPWAPGTRTMFVRITPTEITGRRVHPG